MSKFKSAIKDFEESIQQGNSDESTKLLNKLNKATSKVVKRGIIKKRAASRKISNASKMLKSPN